MDNNNTLITLIVINLIVNIINVINNFINHLKRSKCFGNEIEMNLEVKEDNKKPTQDNDIESIKKLIDILNNNKSNNIDNKIDNKL